MTDFITDFKVDTEYSIEDVFRNCGKYYLVKQVADLSDCAHVEKTCTWFNSFDDLFQRISSIIDATDFYSQNACGFHENSFFFEVGDDQWNTTCYTSVISKQEAKSLISLAKSKTDIDVNGEVD
jgi:hypothetical protein